MEGGALCGRFGGFCCHCVHRQNAPFLRSSRCKLCGLLRLPLQVQALGLLGDPATLEQRTTEHLCQGGGFAVCQQLPVLLLATTRLQPACPPAQATAGSASTGWSMWSQLDPPMRHKQPRQPCSVWLTVHCRRAAPCG